ncbi:MAG: hypothetical protein IJ268_08105, partial [Proteobacteria bacterium]|nr:hypothetical protein [Pseudomonadota bacterium]
MNAAQYLEKRYGLLCELCDQAASGAPGAAVRYQEGVAALDGACDCAVPFRQVAADFRLTSFEAEVVFLSLAPSLDANFRQKIAKLRQNFAFSQPDVGLALELFSPDFASKIENRQAFAPAGALIVHHLIELMPKFGAETQLQDMVLVLPSRVECHLLGIAADLNLDGFSRLFYPRTTVDQVMMGEKYKKQIMTLVTQYENCL